jgi:aspartate aminotransferase
MKLSDRINQIEASGTVHFTQLIQQLRGQGRDIIDLAVGEPPYDTPGTVIEATQQALDAGKTKYSPAAGLPELKSRLARQFDGYDAGNIIISNGSKQCLYAMFQVICNPLDEVIIPRPYWVSFPQQVKLAGGRPVFVDTDIHQLDCEKIERAVTPKTRAVLINSPNNPTGAVYPAADLAGIAKIALERNLYLISDEAYRLFVYDGLKAASPFSFEDIRHRLIVTRSFSKNYGMTGFRIGYIAAPQEFIRAVADLQSHMTGNVCTFAQHGALAALGMDDGELEEWRADMEAKRDYAYQRAAELFDCVKPRGAFYLFPDIRQHLKDGMSSVEFAGRLLENYGVAVVPGEVFGMGGHIRISYAVSEDRLVSGFEKIAEAL